MLTRKSTEDISGLGPYKRKYISLRQNVIVTLSYNDGLLTKTFVIRNSYLSDRGERGVLLRLRGDRDLPKADNKSNQ